MSLYLKYRPSDFTNLVGQSFIKNTLQKSINDNTTVGAYLLCGPRGTGKTSTARLLAKTINCEKIVDGNPCLKCSVCIDFSNNRLVDIIEIDAASYTGVDNIRGIIEKAQFSPTKTKFKIYIIDEVHMLSKGAFNALLKILEEPPSHVKFILATTETHKVPDTIISRCQRYDFKRISDIDIKNRLIYIAKEEKVKIDEESLKYIIKNSSGGLRNAISLFEQLIFDGEINYLKIVEKLEIVDENTISIFLEKLIEGDSLVVEIIEKNISDGKNIKLFFKELIFFTKNKSLELIKKGKNISDYINILDILDNTYSKTKNSLDENITFIIGILKILDGFNNNNNNNKVTKINIEKKEKINNETEKLDYKDLSDVFGEEKNIKEESINDKFNKNEFMEKLKKSGAKGGLTMAIRGGNMKMDDSNLLISVKTKISKAQIENIDNNRLMIDTLLLMGFNNPNISVN